jgi:hypothetical protein
MGNAETNFGLHFFLLSKSMIFTMIAGSQLAISAMFISNTVQDECLSCIFII